MMILEKRTFSEHKPPDVGLSLVFSGIFASFSVSYLYNTRKRLRINNRTSVNDEEL